MKNDELFEYLQAARVTDFSEFNWNKLRLSVEAFIERFDVLFCNGKICVSQLNRCALMKHFHGHCPFFAHQGYTRLQHLLTQRYYWPGIHKNLELHVKHYESCNEAKRGIANIPRSQLHLPFRRLDNLHVDVNGDAALSVQQECHAILTMVDRLSDFVVVKPLRSKFWKDIRLKYYIMITVLFLLQERKN